MMTRRVWKEQHLAESVEWPNSLPALEATTESVEVKESSPKESCLMHGKGISLLSPLASSTEELFLSACWRQLCGVRIIKIQTVF